MACTLALKMIHSPLTCLYYLSVRTILTLIQYYAWLRGQITRNSFSNIQLLILDSDTALTRIFHAAICKSTHAFITLVWSSV